MYHLIDTFNSHRISSHRTIKAAVKADNAYQRAVKRANGESSYIPTAYYEGGTQKTWRSKGVQVDENGDQIV